MTANTDRSDEHLAITQELWPQVNARSLIPVGDGWTCDTYEVDGQWIVQFPRSAYAEEMLRKQLDVLPPLEMKLPAEVPSPFTPRSRRFTAMLYRRINGVPFPEAPDGGWPEELGRFLGALQALRPGDIGLPNVTAGELRKERDRQLRMMTERVLPLVESGVRSRLEQEFATHIGDDRLWEFEPVPVHGDLGPAHILVDARGRLAGVIDWEEVAAGDPASDFAWLVHEKPLIGARVVQAAGVRHDAGWSARALFLYVLMPFHEVIYGLQNGQQLFVETGVRGIRQRTALL